MKYEDVIKKLKGYIYSEHGSASKYAKSKGVSPAYISAILTGLKLPTNDILSDIGLNVKVEKKATYTQV